MRRLIPDRIASRTLLVLVVGLTVSHALSMAIYLTDRVSALETTGGAHIGERIATIDRLVRTAPEAERRRIVELANHPSLQVQWSDEPQLGASAIGWRNRALYRTMSDHLGEAEHREVRVGYGSSTASADTAEQHEPESLGDNVIVSLQEPDGNWLNFTAAIPPPEPFWSFRLVLSMIVMLAAVGILAAIVFHHMARPLARFAAAARRLGLDVRAPPLPESGPLEVREAIQAFNEMQQRIRRFVEDRTQMIAAISHDLGTPITRLRLRAEFIEEPEQRRKMLADLDEMQEMVSSAVSFARDDAADQPRATVDLISLLHRVCDDLTDAGREVRISGDEVPLSYDCRPAAMRRALTNLIDNATKYGKWARLTILPADETIILWIDDDGPGIPPDLLEEVFRPFRRVEASRSRETGGTGLGLTLARTIIRAHGGDICLANRQGGGLRATVSLPRERAAPETRND